MKKCGCADRGIFELELESFNRGRAKKKKGSKNFPFPSIVQSFPKVAKDFFKLAVIWIFAIYKFIYNLVSFINRIQFLFPFPVHNVLINRSQDSKREKCNAPFKIVFCNFADKSKQRGFN